MTQCLVSPSTLHGGERSHATTQQRLEAAALQGLVPFHLSENQPPMVTIPPPPETRRWHPLRIANIGSCLVLRPPLAHLLQACSSSRGVTGLFLGYSQAACPVVSPPTPPPQGTEQAGSICRWKTKVRARRICTGHSWASLMDESN